MIEPEETIYSIPVCESDTCIAEATVVVVGESGELWVCSAHALGFS